MKKGMTTAKLMKGENRLNDEELYVSAPQVMVVGDLRYTRKATDIARIIQALITIFRTQERLNVVGVPTTWNSVVNFDAVETTFRSDQLAERIDELGIDVSRRSLSGILSNVVRKGGVVFAAVGFALPSHIDGTVSKQSMAPALMAFHCRFNPYPVGTWTVTMHVRHQWAEDQHEWIDGDESINEKLRELYIDQIPESSRDILEHTCIPNGMDWVEAEREGYRRWE